MITWGKLSCPVKLVGQTGYVIINENKIKQTKIRVKQFRFVFVVVMVRSSSTLRFVIVKK